MGYIFSAELKNSFIKRSALNSGSKSRLYDATLIGTCRQDGNFIIFFELAIYILKGFEI